MRSHSSCLKSYVLVLKKLSAVVKWLHGGIKVHLGQRPFILILALRLAAIYLRRECRSWFSLSSNFSISRWVIDKISLRGLISGVKFKYYLPLTSIRFYFPVKSLDIPLSSIIFTASSW